MNYETEDQEFCKASNPNTYVWVKNHEEPEKEVCPLCLECLETDSHFIKYGVCCCVIWGKWNDSVTTETFEEFTKSNYKPLN